MFADSMTEHEINRAGSASDLRYFHTTYGETFGYNERARMYHRSYGLVTPPNNPSFSDYRLGDLATAPLFRRDHLGFRVDYPEEHFSWSQSALKLKKNQKQYGDDYVPGKDRSINKPIKGNLPVRIVRWRGGGAPINQEGDESYPASGSQSARDDEQEQLSPAQIRQQQAEFESAYHAHQHQLKLEADKIAAAAQISPAPRAILTSSLTAAQINAASASSSSSPYAGRQQLSETERQLDFDRKNPNRYPNPGFKTSQHNPQFDPPPMR